MTGTGAGTGRIGIGRIGTGKTGTGEVGTGKIGVGTIEREEAREGREAGCMMLALRRSVLGFAPGDLLLVVPEATAEGGELVVDLHGRVGRHGGGPILGVIVGAVRQRVLPGCKQVPRATAATTGAPKDPRRIDPRTLPRGCTGAS